MIKKHESHATPQALAEQIEADLRTRSGLGELWDRIDPDTRLGILQRWAEIIAGEAPPHAE